MAPLGRVDLLYAGVIQNIDERRNGEAVVESGVTKD
jgi:hypothetical protein